MGELGLESSIARMVNARWHKSAGSAMHLSASVADFMRMY
jgi:hypothetical protein